MAGKLETKDLEVQTMPGLAGEATINAIKC